MAEHGDRIDIVLASASPRRLDLLHQVGLIPAEVKPVPVDETPKPGEKPRDLARRLALAKAAAAARERPGKAVLAADTVVAAGRRILPTPDDRAAARACLSLLSGRRHRVYGGVSLRLPDGAVRCRVVVTVVTFKRLTEDEIERYLDSGEWQGKAGGYAVQGRAGAFVCRLNGSYSNVVGLPLFETVGLLRGAGLLARRPVPVPERTA